MSGTIDDLPGLFARFERLTGLRFRLVAGEGEAAEVVHDSLAPGDSRTRVGREDRLPDGRPLSAVVEGESERAALAAEYLLDSARRLLGARQEVRLFTREMLDSYEQITLLTSIGDVLGSVIEVEAAADVILGELVEVLEADRATLWLTEDGEEEPREVAFRERLSTAEAPAVRELERRLATRAFRRRETSVTTVMETGSAGGALAVPVTYAPARGPGRRVGALSLVRAPSGDPFAAGDLRLLEAVATQIGAAVQTGRLVRESLRRERLMAELEIAHDLQLKLLPDLEGFSDTADAAARSEPVEGVGGDFYLLIRLPAGRLGVMLGDVSSHGISAALIMALTMSAASVHARAAEGPADVLERVHRQLLRELESTEMYTSIFFGVLDREAMRLRYANAGHPHAFRLSSRACQRLEALDAPLGLARPSEYAEAEVGWDPWGDTLLLFTDGLVADGDGPAGRAERALLEAASAAAPGGARAVVEAVFERAAARRPESGRGDDRSALAVRLREPPG